MYTSMRAFILTIFVVKLNANEATIGLAEIVLTTNGPIMGQVIQTANYSYAAYKGVPYAEPPIEELRFEAPIPLRSNWTTPRFAIRTAEDCMQLTPEKKIIGSEDCLYLNVFVPLQYEETSASGQSSNKPVIVFIHGGGFMWGSARSYGEHRIMENGRAILVTLNYRLGALGFLSTEDDHIQGNMGLKDQAMALRWVNKNIERFGGNPKQVLLAGWSAGGASVHYHLVSSYTEDSWFNSAMSFSGNALCACHAIYPQRALEKAKLMALHMNCEGLEGSSEPTRLIKSCLKNRMANDIVFQTMKFYKYHSHPFAIFGPVLERSSGDAPFLTDYVDNLMSQKKIKLKPWLMAVLDPDGGFPSAEFLKKDSNGRELIYELNDRWLELAPIMLFFNETYSTAKKFEMAANLKKAYFEDKPIGLETYSRLELLMSNELSMPPYARTIELYGKFIRTPLLYGLRYDNPAPYGYGQILSQRTDWTFGTMHGDDIFVIFNNTEVRGGHELRVDEQRISKDYIQMMITFAQTGQVIYDERQLKPFDLDEKPSISTIYKTGIHVMNTF